MVPEAGDIVFETTTVPGHGAETAVTLTTTSPTGIVTGPVACTSSDAGLTWGANATYATGGVWRLLFTITGEGAGADRREVAVAPAFTTGRSYATSVDLADWLQAAPPLDADRMLRNATREVDRLIRTAVYEVSGDDEMPTDPDIRKAVREATCELVSWWEETGDEHGARSAVTSANIGGVSVTAARSSGGSEVSTRVGPLVWTILSDAGLLGHAPWTE